MADAPSLMQTEK